MLRKLTVFLLATAFSLSVFAGSVFSYDQRSRVKSPLQSPEHVYGSQLMTDQEKNEYFKKLQDAKNDKQRENIRREHHERMKKRANEMGVTLPDEPPPLERGKGLQRGPGRGMGPQDSQKGPHDGDMPPGNHHRKY